MCFVFFKGKCILKLTGYICIHANVCMIEQLLQELSPLPTQMSHELFEVESNNMSSGIIFVYKFKCRQENLLFQHKLFVVEGV